MWRKAEFSSLLHYIITLVFSVTWSFRNYSDLICWCIINVGNLIFFGTCDTFLFLWPGLHYRNKLYFTIYSNRKLHIFIWPFNSSTLYSNWIWSNLSSSFFKYTHTFDPLSIEYLLTASFSCKTNTRFIFSILIPVFIKKKKKTSYVRLTKTCNSTCMLLLFCWFWLLL